ncbi:hypothetical protein [Bifidobacterium callimiconis]|uniref:Uncharacterized protein n=1 Tax=Bifidobacterium callimiconis TaxID=2306973 RepID=A0A430FIF9_9BIFI|nr:hypothetical protein [Bifidobacterium callimiconis]RSX52673.1 hypothetical protein D2E23_0401 [Bifidobacterium callimiconis]
MNVSESLDWKPLDWQHLEHHRYIARTWNNTIIDGHLTARTIGPMLVMRDRDLPIDVIITNPNGNTLSPTFRSINILKETA